MASTIPWCRKAAVIKLSNTLLPIDTRTQEVSDVYSAVHAVELAYGSKGEVADYLGCGVWLVNTPEGTYYVVERDYP